MARAWLTLATRHLPPCRWEILSDMCQRIRFLPGRAYRSIFYSSYYLFDPLRSRQFLCLSSGNWHGRRCHDRRKRIEQLTRSLTGKLPPSYPLTSCYLMPSESTPWLRWVLGMGERRKLGDVAMDILLFAGMVSTHFLKFDVDAGTWH